MLADDKNSFARFQPGRGRIIERGSPSIMLLGIKYLILQLERR